MVYPGASLDIRAKYEREQHGYRPFFGQTDAIRHPNNATAVETKVCEVRPQPNGACPHPVSMRTRPLAANRDCPGMVVAETRLLVANRDCPGMVVAETRLLAANRDCPAAVWAETQPLAANRTCPELVWAETRTSQDCCGKGESNPRLWQTNCLRKQ